MPKAFSLKFTITLAILLITPFGFRLLAPELEPYPAIILPSGASEIPVNNQELKFTANNLWGKNKQGSWERIDPVQFLEPIPSHFFFAIIENEFGLLDAPKRVETRFSLTQDFEVRAIIFSEQEKEMTISWLQNKLNVAGLSPDELRITEEEILINKITGLTISEKITDEKIIKLAQ